MQRFDSTVWQAGYPFTFQSLSQALRGYENMATGMIKEEWRSWTLPYLSFLFHVVLSDAGAMLSWQPSELPTPESLCLPRAER